MAHPRRLIGVSYTGLAAYFVTTCTLARRNVFHDIEFGREAADLLIAHSARCDFEVSAYCLMPDHAHVLVTARTQESSLSDLARTWKQTTGYRWHVRRGGRLWQAGYFERVLRADEPALSVSRYIIENPVRAGLVTSAEDYPLTGSSCYSVAQIADAARIEFGRHQWRR
jgi:REP element-mobilizing transposase RayT